MEVLYMISGLVGSAIGGILCYFAEKSIKKKEDEKFSEHIEEIMAMLGEKKK